MKRLIQLVMVLAPLAGCAHLLPGSDAGSRARLWTEGHEALARNEFAAAESAFTLLSERYPRSLEGRESLFYLGSIHLDPRNPEWDPEPAEEHFNQYLSFAGTNDGPRVYRYPEAAALHELARQLNLPPEARVPGLQPGERVVRVEDRVVVPASESRELTEQVERLREQLAERDARIRQQQEELDRIRRTLTAPPRQ
jgi:TolA-binding protein